MAQDRAKVAELFGGPCDANTDKETALYRNKRLRKGSAVFKKACEPGDYRMRCFDVLYLRNEGFAGLAEDIKLLAGACEKIRAVCHNPPAAICAKNISQAKNAVVARVNCYIMRRYAAKACVLARKRGRLGLASRSSGEKEF